MSSPLLTGCLQEGPLPPAARTPGAGLPRAALSREAECMVSTELYCTVALRYQNIISVIVMLPSAWYSLKPMHRTSLSCAWWLRTVHQGFMEARDQQ